MRWLKRLPALVTILTTLTGVAAWHEIRYAKAADVEALKQTIAELATELKVGQLENRRTVLRGEEFRLKSAPTPTGLERQRLFDVENELHDVEQQLERLRRGTR